MPSPDTPPLRLLLQGLSERDIARVGAFLKVGRGRLQRDWTIAFEGEAHVILCGEEDLQTVRGLIDNPVSVLRLTAGPGDADSGRLAMPLDYDSLIESLVATEARLLPRRALAPASAPARPAPAKIAPAAAAPTADAALPAGARFRLRRWPSADVLRNSRHRVRLASFLSARSVDVADLVRLSNVPEPECIAFLQALKEGDLLQYELPAAVATAPAAPPAPAETPSAPARGRPAVDAGLLGRLRRRFGLGAEA